MQLAHRRLRGALMNQKSEPATRTKRYVKRGSYTAEIRPEGNLYRFVIRDDNREKPSIHGSKQSMKESEQEVETVLAQLCRMKPAA
jgi:hypothetical protein